MTDHTLFGGRVLRAPHVLPNACKWCKGEIVSRFRTRRYCDLLCREQARFDRERKRKKELRLDPEWLERKNRKRREWRRSIAGIRSRLKSARKGRLNGRYGFKTRAKYLAKCRRVNRNVERRKRQSSWSHANKTKYVGKDLKPHCAECNTEIPWAGVGRPRKYCPVHDHLWFERPESKRLCTICARPGLPIIGYCRPWKYCDLHHPQVLRSKLTPLSSYHTPDSGRGSPTRVDRPRPRPLALIA